MRKSVLFLVAALGAACQPAVDEPGTTSGSETAQLMARASAACFEDGWKIWLRLYETDPGCALDLDLGEVLYVPLPYSGGGTATVPDEIFGYSNSPGTLAGEVKLAQFQLDLFDDSIQAWDDLVVSSGDVALEVTSNGDVRPLRGSFTVLACPPFRGFEQMAHCQEFPGIQAD